MAVRFHQTFCNSTGAVSGNGTYLLNVSDVHQLDDFVLFGGARPGAGALKAQVTVDVEKIHTIRAQSYSLKTGHELAYLY